MLSFVLVTAGFGGILLGCSEASSFALAHPFVWAPLIGGIACLIAFARRQRRIESPLVNLDIFAVPSFRAGFWAQCLLCASFMGITLLVPLYVQNLCGGTALDAGLVLLPGTVVALLGNPIAGYLTDKVGVRPVALFGTTCMAAGAVAMMLCNEPYALVARGAFSGRALCGRFGAHGAVFLVEPCLTCAAKTLPMAARSALPRVKRRLR